MKNSSESSFDKGAALGSSTVAALGSMAKAERVWNRNFVLAFLIMSMHSISNQFFLPVLPLYFKSLGGHATDIGMIFGIYSIAALISRIFTGRALDIWGRKRTLLVGAFLFFIAILLYSVANSVQSVLYLRFFHGIGFGIVGTACGVVVADVAPQKRRGEALAYYSLTNIIPMAVGSAIALTLISVSGLPLSGFSLLFAACGVVAAIELMLTLFVGETKPPASRDLSSSQPGARTAFSIKGVFSRKAIPLAIAMGFAAFANGGVISFVAIYLSAGSTGNIAAFFFTNAVAMAISRPAIGLLIDRIDRRIVVIPLMLSTAIGVAILTLGPTLPVAVAAAVLLGAGFGPLNPTLMALVVDVVGPQERGAAMATFMASMDIGIGAGSVLLGFVAQAAGYRAVFPFSAAAAALGLVYFFLYQRPSRSPRLAAG